MALSRMEANSRMSHSDDGWRRWYKRQMARFWRRLGRKLLDDAPSKRPTRFKAD